MLTYREGLYPMELDDVSKVDLSLFFRFYFTIIFYMYFSLCFCSVFFLVLLFISLILF